MAKTLFEWNELNLIREEAERIMSLPVEERQKQKDRFCDYLEYVLCLVYGFGWKDAEEVIGSVRMKDGLDDKCVNLEIANKTFRERADEWILTGTAAELIRLIDTESVRDYNTGVTDCGKESGRDGLKKRWNTQLDWKVRDAHMELEGQTVGIDDLFYVADDCAYAPGGFESPDLNVNCRCFLTLAT